MSTKRIAIEGASGYSGMELTRILSRHPNVELVAVTSGRWEGATVGKTLGLVGPAQGLVYAKSVPDSVHVDAVVFATPAEASRDLADGWLARGAAVVDLSDAFRADPAWVYGLTEHARDALQPGTLKVANPGCYPTATQTALKPLVEADLVAPGPIIVDAKSGVTGAGRTLSDAYLYNELADNHYPYKVGQHRHVPEIERGLGGREVLFTPHLLPCRRGLLISAYFPVAATTTARDLEAYLRGRYRPEPLVQVVTPDAALGIGNVVGTPTVRVAVCPTIKAGTARVFASLDNLLKGAAGQAVQNLNLILGFDETAGLL